MPTRRQPAFTTESCVFCVFCFCAVRHQHPSTIASEADARAAAARPFASTIAGEAHARAAAARPSASTIAKEANARAAAARPSASTIAGEAHARAAAARPSAITFASSTSARTVLLKPTAHHDGESGWRERRMETLSAWGVSNGVGGDGRGGIAAGLQSGLVCLQT